MSFMYKMKKPKINKRPAITILSCILALLLLCSACGTTQTADVSSETVSQEVSSSAGAIQAPDYSADGIVSVSLSDIPEYNGELSVILNGNIPYFSAEELSDTDPFEEYSPLDSLGRCGTAYANICRELMPEEERGDISEIHPTGWHSSFYDFVDGESLYNRCHLIAHELAGEDANELNLITGTRTFNKDGMEPYENMVADYVHKTGNHVLYRVTPLFDGSDLVAKGVVMEAYSVEDDGEGICFCVFCYNVEPGVGIDYAAGDNWLDVGDDFTYVLNTNSMKFHLPTCPGVSDISEHNKSEYTGSRDDLLEMGYSPCKTCNP